MNLRTFIIAVIVLPALLLSTSVAHATGEASLTVDLPELTQTANLTVSGQTVPDSIVQSAGSTSKADAAGHFTLPVQLVEGNNTLVVEAKSPGGKLLRWSGSITLDTAGPVVETIVPDVTNMYYFKLAGRTEPGAHLTLNGSDVTLSSGGDFETWVDVQKTPVLKFVATDAAGNKNEFERTVTLVKTDPAWLVWDSYVVVSGTAAPGTHLSDPYRPASTPITVGPDGKFQWRQFVPQDQLFRFWLRFEPPGGKGYLHLYEFDRDLLMDVPDFTNYKNLPLSGSFSSGYQVTFNHVPIAPDDIGSFTTVQALRPGDNYISVAVTTPYNRTENHLYHIVYQPDLPEIKGNQVLYPISGSPFARAWVRDREEIPAVTTGMDRRAVLPLPIDLAMKGVYIDEFSDGKVTSRLYRLGGSDGRSVYMVLDSKKALVNGTDQSLDVAPQLIDDYTYVPLRFVAEALGAYLLWDAASSTATFFLDRKSVEIKLDSMTAKVSGEVQPMPAPARLIDARTLVPLRFVTESLGAQVFWDATTRSITLVRQ